jgi:hypothetical protein
MFKPPTLTAEVVDNINKQCAESIPIVATKLHSTPIAIKNACSNVKKLLKKLDVASLTSMDIVDLTLRSNMSNIPRNLIESANELFEILRNKPQLQKLKPLAPNS